MKEILLVLEGDVAKSLLKRLVEANITHSHYDIVYNNDNLIKNIEKRSNFLFYKFDATSYSKISLLLNKKQYYSVLVVNSNRFDTVEIVKNIKKILPNISLTVYNIWDLEFDYKFLQNFNALYELSNALIQMLPNIPVLAQNVGLKNGDILEVAIPYSSFYAYKYVGSISQKQFKISAIYRNNNLILPKPTTIIKPNDILLLIGNPKILIHIYKQITQVVGYFPLPFGTNLYLFLDLKYFSKQKALNLVKKSVAIHKRLNSNKLVIKIINLSTVEMLDKIEYLIKDIKNSCECEIDYSFGLDFTIIKKDIIRFDVGLCVFDKSEFKNKRFFDLILELNLPVYKVNSLFSFLDYKNISVALNEIDYYEQIIPTIFDIASQLNFEINFIDANPYAEHNKNIQEYLRNLENIFNNKINFIKNNKNPVRELLKLDNNLQVLPLTKELKTSLFISKFLTNSDIILFNQNRFDQFLIPISKGQDEI